MSDQTIKFISMRDTCKLLGLSRTTVWKLGKEDPSFPKRVALGSQRHFVQHELEAWMLRKLSEREQAAA